MNAWILIRLQIDAYLSPYTKLNSKLIEDLNIRSDTLNNFREKLGNSFSIHHQQTYRGDHRQIFIHSSLKENEVSRNKPNQGSEGPL